MAFEVIEKEEIREAETVETTAETIEETKTNTFNPELLAMELELEMASFRAKKMIYEYDKICG